MFKKNISSGSTWEPITGYSRAVRMGNLIFVSATAATDKDGHVLHPNDAYQQARTILSRLDGVLQEAGASLLLTQLPLDAEGDRLDAILWSHWGHRL